MLNLGSIKIPINAATKTFALLAKRGAGKSYTGAVMAEEFHKNNIPFVVFDPIDVWWGLRLAKNGKDKGLPVVVFGLEHADIQIDRDMGKRIAQEIVRENVSCVISTFGMPKVAQRHLIAEFAEELLKINNTPRHIFIEEAHEFIPQRVTGALGKCFAAVESLVVMGRNRGLGVTLINQRAATINKDVLTQLDTLIALRNVGPQDRKALRDWVEFHTAEGDFDKFMASLPSLPTGEAWIWSPEFMNVFERVKIRSRETFHPDREKLGHNFVMPELDQVDIQSFITKFSALKKEKPQKVKEHLPEKYIEEPVVEKVDIVALKNDYESKLMQKDIELRKLNDTLNQIRRLVGGGETTTSSVPVSGGNVSMWLEKLGNGGSSKILKFLVERPGNSFTRQQLALAVGASVSSVTHNWVPLLKRNLLVKEEKNQIRINPDL